MARLTATEASRGFSDVLGRVAAGEEIEVTRAGTPVAVIGPPRRQLITAERFRELLASAPRPDDDFAADLRTARRSVAPAGDPWQS
ncbi:type II toxin-antitoxin system prevent-host-death family antitoxin [Svornostia abyssi]|uniref:Type II toxin-antitoxin system prevent-host-death family antitoxin n=1 Tax=Svornostia abyssi TaxID=2898438 RepID=A0ABY5PI50_9ACTN|nr:type II toxin-antitoxin system prevent-host-death family antitoxin [Parviterribacteraceae bacterium J379]